MRALRAATRPLPWLVGLVVALAMGGPAGTGARVASARTAVTPVDVVSAAARLEPLAPASGGQLQPPASVPGLVGVILRASPSPEGTGSRVSGHALPTGRRDVPTRPLATRAAERERAAIARGGVTPYFPTAPPAGR